MDLKYKRVLLKISGEAFGDDESKLFDFQKIEEISKLICEIKNQGVEIAIVNGAGNLFRGASHEREIDAEKGHYIGMVATVMNSLALDAALCKQNTLVATYSSLPIEGLVPKFNAKQAREDLKSGKVVISTAGVGKPFFTTDTAGAQRAVDLGCELLIKASTIDGVYSDDPRINEKATRYEKISYNEVLRNNLKVMDKKAIKIAKDNNLKIIVTKFSKENILMVLEGEKAGTEIS